MATLSHFEILKDVGIEQNCSRMALMSVSLSRDKLERDIYIYINFLIQIHGESNFTLNKKERDFSPLLLVVSQFYDICKDVEIEKTDSVHS